MRRFFTLIVMALTVCALTTSPALAQKGGGSGDPSLDEPSGGGAPTPAKGYERYLKRAINDIRSFWADEFSAQYGDAPYEEVSKNEIFAMSSDSRNAPECGGTALSYDEVSGNAQYARCASGEKFIWWDDEQLFPQLYNDYGQFAVALVLAHEWGHAIQDQIGQLDFPNTQVVERQADCFAGAWSKRVSDGDSVITLEGGDLDSALSALLQVADPVGTDPSSDPGAHGSAFDRVSSFEDGLSGGAGACVPYFDNPPLSTEIPFTDEQEAASGGNAPADTVIPVTVDLLNDFYTQVAGDVYKPLTLDDLVEYDSSGKKSQLPKCGGTRLARKDITSRLFYCIDDGYIGYDLPYLQNVYDSIGDFGVATLFANTWATYVQTLQKFPGVENNDLNAVFGADCYTGGFAAAMYNELLHSDKLSDTGDSEVIVFSPGDLDETIQAFLDYNKTRLAASDIQNNFDLTFKRVKNFKGGFLDGYQSCASFQDPSSVDLPSA